MELALEETIVAESTLDTILETASQSLAENVPGWVESPIQVDLEENFHPLEQQNLNVNQNPLVQQELQREERYPDVKIQNKYPYVRIKERWQGKKSKEQLLDSIIQGIREKLKDFYERSPNNNNGMDLFALNKYKIQMQAQFYFLRPESVGKPENQIEENDLIARSLKTFPLGQNGKTLIEWKKASQNRNADQFIPNMGLQTQEEADRQSVEKWLTELREKLEDLLDEYLDKLTRDGTEEKEKNYTSIKVDGFRKNCQITFIWHGNDKPDFDELVNVRFGSNVAVLPPEDEDIIINPNVQQLSQSVASGSSNESSVVLNTQNGNIDVGCSKTSKETIFRGSYVLWSTNTKKNRCAIYCVLKKLELGAPVLDEKGSTTVKQRKDDIIKDFLRAQYEKDGSQLTFPMPIKEC
jgi:hypothetical protein